MIFKTNDYRLAVPALLIASLLTLAALPAGARNVFTRRAVYLPGNPLSAGFTAKSEEVMKRSSDAGYNMVWFDQAKIVPNLYLHKDAKTINALKTLKSRAESYGLKLCPCSHGQTEPCWGSLKHAEAMPVKGTRFLVAGTEAFAVADTLLSIPNAGFDESRKPHTPNLWNLYGGIIPGKTAFLDSAEIRPGSDGKASFRVENPPKRTKMMSRAIRVTPRRAYRVSLWIKTQEFSNPRDIGIEVRGVDASPRELYRIRDHNGIAGTQGWQKESFDFNSLDHRLVQIRVAATDLATVTGTVWFDDVSIEEVGLYEIVRRSTLPIVVRSEDGKTFREGTDYTIGAGPEPKKGEQAKLIIPEGSGIQSVKHVRVDWYQLADMRRRLPAASYCHAEVWDEVQASANMISDVFGRPPAWYTKPGEWANAFWDPACQLQFKTAGEFMGAAWTGIINVIRKATQNWNVDTYVISDMVDPYHNGGHDVYFTVNGPTEGAWRTLDKGAIIMNWNEGKKLQTLRFFGGLDPQYPNVYFRQVLHLWSGSDISADKGWLPALEQAEAEGLKDGSVVGIEYATWHPERDNGYDRIEAYAEACTKAGRWAVDNPSWPPAASARSDAEKPRGQGMRIFPLDNGNHGQISFAIPQNEHVRLEIVNVLGQVVRTPVNRKLEAGTHTAKVKSSHLPTGVYFVNLSVAESGMARSLSRKWIVL